MQQPINSTESNLVPLQCTDKPIRIALVAGEVSGDILGSNLILELQKIYPNASFEGVAGSGMQALGCKALFEMEELAVMGLVEVLGRLCRLLSIRKQLLQHWLANPPDIFIGIDAPDFNLTLEEQLKRQGIKTVHYVSPSIWAWRQKRVFKVQRATHLVLALLPFEKAFYDKFNVPCQFVGHTLADQIPLINDKNEARKALALAGDKLTIGLFCGSRSSEIELLAPVFLTAIKQLSNMKGENNIQFITAYVNDKRLNQLKAIKETICPELNIHFFPDSSREVMAASDALLMASGTATLEAMLIKRPMVVAYKFKWLSYQIFKRLVKVAHFSLPNLLANKALVPELLQNEVTPEHVFQQLNYLLAADNEPLVAQFLTLHQILKKDAGFNAAHAISNLINTDNKQTHE